MKKRGKREWVKELCFKNNIHFVGIQESKMTRLELFRIKSMWGNYNFDYACSLSRGRSGGRISIWDPNSFSKQNIWCHDSYIIIQGKWLHYDDTYYMINVYGPQESEAKAMLWSTLHAFMHDHNGK